MIAINRPLPRLFAAVSAAMLTLTACPTAVAQETTGDNIILEAVEAAKKLESLTATVKLSGEGGFKDFVPTGNGKITLLKSGEPVDGTAWFSRVDTDYIHKKGEETEAVTALRTPELFVYVDHEKKAVLERSRTDRRSKYNSVVDLFALPEITSASPYRRELREATNWEAVGRETVNGVECDVVEVRYDMAKGESDDTGRIIRTPGSKWYFGIEDRLPRRIERITDEGMISFSIILDITDLTVNPPVELEAIKIATPEGYSRTYSAKRTAREAKQNTAPPSTDADAAAPQIDPVDIKLPAHGFELVDGAGNEVSLESLKGNVTVLYFWGTWCVPCKNFSPLVSDLVTTFEGEPVKVFGLPVRERSEDAVREAMSKYKHTLLLNPGGNPIGCDATARAYKVRRYPTIYVIGAESEPLAVKVPEAGVDPAETMADVENTIREYLKTMN